MQQAQQSGVPIDQQRIRAERTAWVVLFGAFAVCCMLFGSLLYGGWRYRMDATDSPIPGGKLFVRSAAFADSITWIPRGTTEATIAIDQQALNEGDEIRIARTVGSPYGQAASVRLFDQTQLDLWSGADVTLQTIQTSRWSGTIQTVTILQKDGYVRYDLRADQPYQQVRYKVLVGQAEVLLTPGGSYSIDMTASNRRLLLPTSGVDSPRVADIAVRDRGRVEVHGRGSIRSVLPGQKVQIDPVGIPSLAVPARWELIPDIRFSEFSEEQYNNTTIPITQQASRSTTWQVSSLRKVEGDTPNGYFRINQKCWPLGSSNSCEAKNRVNVANFYRVGGQTTGFLTAVLQPIDKDISEYRSLRLSAWLRILNQSLPNAGEAGVECPVMIKLTYKGISPEDRQQDLIWCFYSKDEPDKAKFAGEIFYQKIPPYEWFNLNEELRRNNRLPEARYLQSIQVYADGHDYNSEITDISLVGEQ